MFYLAGYALMNIGAFAVVIHIGGKGEKNLRIEDLSGLARVQPMTAIFLTIFLLSLIGVPLTAGFFGKLYVFKAALQSKLVWLAILGLLNTAVAAYYYLRLIFLMYMAEPSDAVKKAEPVGFGLQAALALPAAGTFFLGILPTSVLDFVLRSSNFGR